MRRIKSNTDTEIKSNNKKRKRSKHRERRHTDIKVKMGEMEVKFIDRAAEEDEEMRKRNA